MPVSRITHSVASYKRPESVLVVIHTSENDCLLLERVVPSGFWQSVTGSLHWDEPATVAARREVKEETGIEEGRLVDGGYSERFPILPSWRHRYRPDVRVNTEHVFFWELEGRVSIELDPQEHSRFEWLPLAKAVARVDSWTNRQALQLLETGLKNV